MSGKGGGKGGGKKGGNGPVAWTGASIRELARARLKASDEAAPRWGRRPSTFAPASAPQNKFTPHRSPEKSGDAPDFSDFRESQSTPDDDTPSTHFKGTEPALNRDAEDQHEFRWGNYQESVGNRVYVVVPGSSDDEGEEIEQLCRTLGLGVVETEVLNPKRRVDNATFLGSGTLEDMGKRMQRAQCTALVVDAALSPVQVRNMERILNAPVVDREGIILSIFERHAQTRLAKMQVELAQLKYLQPRLTGIWSGLSRQRGGRGGQGGRGQGETRLELDRRVVKDRIVTLSKKLRDAEKSFHVQSRRRSQLPRVALVGYTNAGKSTLMHQLTGSEVLTRDSLFSTLDTTVRPLVPPTEPKILLSDTVGFVAKLPHGLVASFKSTLSEALESRLLVHVLDVSHPHWKNHFETTESVLAEIGGEALTRILVMNKMDQLGPVARIRLSEVQRYLKDFEQYRGAVSVSALTGQGLVALREKLIEECGAHLPAWSHA